MNTKNALSATKFYLKKYGIVKTIKKVFKAVDNRVFKKNVFDEEKRNTFNNIVADLNQNIAVTKLFSLLHSFENLPLKRFSQEFAFFTIHKANY